MRTLVITQANGNQLSGATLSTITAAKAIGAPVDAFIMSAGNDELAKSAAITLGVNKIYHVVNNCFEHPLAEDVCAAVLMIADQYSHILAPANTFGKNIAPRIAAKLDSSQISDITEVVSEDTFVRPIYAGNAFCTVRSSDPIKVITIRPTAFEQVALDDADCEIEVVDFKHENKISKFISAQVSTSDRPELATAKIVVSGGRGLKDAHNFKLIEQLADQLNAAVGASRAAVDAGFIANEYQVGQTGKVIAPDLYIAIGISGAIQHLAGISDSKVIVAINKDPDAPIFEVADYGLASDFFDVLPALQTELEKLGYHKK